MNHKEYPKKKRNPSKMALELAEKLWIFVGSECGNFYPEHPEAIEMAIIIDAELKRMKTHDME